MPPGGRASPQTGDNALLARLWHRTQQPGCVRHAMGQDILARHMRTATAPPLASLLLRRAHTADYNAPDAPIIVTASAAEPSAPPLAVRRSPSVRAWPVPLSGVTTRTPYPASPEPPPPVVPASPVARTGPRPRTRPAALTGPGAPTGRDPAADRRPLDGPGGTDNPTRTDGEEDTGGVGNAGSVGGAAEARGAESTGGADSRVAGNTSGAGSTSGAEGSRGAGTKGKRSVQRAVASSWADSPRQTWSMRPRPAPLVEHERPSGPAAQGDMRSTNVPASPASADSARPVVFAGHVTGIRRPVVPERTAGNGARRPEAGAPGIAARTLLAGTVPTALREAGQRGDRPAAPADGGKVPGERHPEPASRHSDPPVRPDDPARRDRDTPQPPRIDIDGIVTTVQRRLVHHMAIERERRGMPR